jgi:16S rRNA G966 N2-methylase RsmD
LQAILVEHETAACRVIEENLRRTRVYDRATVVRADALKFLKERAASEGPFDVVLIDPPYAEPHLIAAALTAISAAVPVLLKPQAWVVAKHFWRTPPPQTVGLLASVRTRRFGETGLTFYRLPDPPQADMTSGPEEAAR